jgi:hypothetical protein
MMKHGNRENRFGGSAGGGGYDYQAEAWALVAAKILAEESLNWVESGCDRVPVSIRTETGEGGDDLRITLRSGARIEAQAKRGLRRGKRLWDALMALACAVEADEESHGVLLTTTDASNTIRKHLKQGIIKVGEGITEDLPDIVREFIDRLHKTGINDLSICSRIRVVIRDLDPGSPGEEITFEALRKVLADPSEVGAARNTLVSDGHDQIKLRGSRDANSLTRVIKQAGISLSVAVENQLILRQRFRDWSIKTNSRISIPSLNIALPMSEAWVRLRAMSPSDTPSGGKSLEEQVKEYHEWHRLADARHVSDTLDIGSASHRERLLVVVGGPGAGKSTLLRRLTWDWAAEGQVVLRVSLRAVALRMSQGETFDEALLAVASEGFPNIGEPFYSMLSNATLLLADGLDETDPNRSGIADRLQRWAFASPERQVVLTTRPVGHNPAWFEEWKHYELLPLGRSDIEGFAEIVFGLLHPDDPEEAEKSLRGFLEELDHSHTASIAARNPQLLGFLIALYVKGHDIGGNRFQLFDKTVEEVRKQTAPDRVFQHQVDAPIAHQGLDCTGWLMLHSPNLSEVGLVEGLGQHLAEELPLRPLQARQIASEVLLFWEERGLLERVSAGTETTFTFVHMAFQEFTAARFLVRLPDEELIAWIRSNYNSPGFRETLLLTGATDRVSLTINTLIELDDPSDPVCTAAILAADVLAEAEDSPTDLQEAVFRHLVPRLTSRVPMVVYEAGEKLRLLAMASPGVVGPMALRLQKREQQWTKEVACALGLLSGNEYVDSEELLAVFPEASDTRVSPGRSSAFGHRPLIRDLIVEGAKYLLQDGASERHLEVVKAKYEAGNYSGGAHQALFDSLAEHLTPKDMATVISRWHAETYQTLASWIQVTGESDQAFIEAVLKAVEGLTAEKTDLVADPQLNSIATLRKALRIWDSPATDYAMLRYRRAQDEFSEVIRGAILVAGLSPAQVRADADQALHELKHSPKRLYELTKNAEKSNIEPNLNWARAQDGQLQPDLLLQAMAHPSSFVIRFAALLLLNCVEDDVVAVGLQDVLASGSGYVLYVIAQVASDVWQDEAADLILDRLERRLTDDCAPLIRALGDTCDESTRLCAQAVLRKAFESESADIVEAALDTTQKLGLDEALAITIESSYRWWLIEGPQDPEGGGVIPENAASALFTYLAANKRMSFDEIREAANAKRYDVRQVAIQEIGRFLAKEDKLVEPVLSDIDREELPSGIIGELSKSYPIVCKRHLERFLGLLGSDNRQVRIACIRALGDGWADSSEVEEALRSLLSVPDPGIRDEAVRALRRLRKH